MEKLTEFLESKLLPIATKISSQKYLKAISTGILTVMPFMIIGCFAMIIWCPPLDPATMNPGFWQTIMQGWTNLATALDMPCNLICTICLDCMGVYVIPSIAYQLAKAEKMEGMLPTGLATVCFFICCAFDAEGSFGTSYLGGAGLFAGILMSILSIECLKFLIAHNVGRIEILGDAVPAAITQSFISLIPSGIIIVCAALINWAIISITGSPLPSLIAVILSPIVSAINNPFGIMILAMLTCVFWWFGIHDSAITGVLDPFLDTMLLANATAIASGTAATDLPYIVNESFYWIFITVGGSGATLALAILLTFFSKSKQCKTVGKLGIIPALFNINEPIIFGLPIMLNPVMFIPFVLAHGLNALVAYIAMAAKLVNTPYIYPGWNLPAPLGALLATLDVKAVFLMIVIILLDMLLYYPFFKIYDKQMKEEETKA
ncbi:MAG: PTS sugar transporter subunit IIC [Erysipelotrichaceae bacterium]|nr:PTS sugar transporter subunit IIC [Erysipelotrichaceae bacterium]